MASECPEWRWEPGDQAELCAVSSRVSVSLLLTTICPCIFIHKFPLSVFHSYKRSWKFITRRQEATQAHTLLTGWEEVTQLPQTGRHSSVTAQAGDGNVLLGYAV